MAEEPAEAEAALLALGLARRHLQEVLLDGRVLPLGAFRPLPGCARVAGADAAPDAPRFVALDGSAFDNLEVCCFFLEKYVFQYKACVQHDCAPQTFCPLLLLLVCTLLLSHAILSLLKDTFMINVGKRNRGNG